MVFSYVKMHTPTLLSSEDIPNTATYRSSNVEWLRERERERESARARVHVAEQATELVSVRAERCHEEGRGNSSREKQPSNTSMSRDVALLLSVTRTPPLKG
jgi:hypothetical protein